MMQILESEQEVMDAGGITITTERLEDMKFSNPTFDSGLVLIVTEKKQSFFWLFLEAFDWNLWIY